MVAAELCVLFFDDVENIVDEGGVFVYQFFFEEVYGVGFF